MFDINKDWNYNKYVDGFSYLFFDNSIFFLVDYYYIIHIFHDTFYFLYLIEMVLEN